MSTLPKKIQDKVEYGFEEGKHHHYLLIDGEKKSLTGVTTILNVLSKPMLIQWSANMAVDYVRDQFNNSDRVIRPLKTKQESVEQHWYELADSVFESILEGAKTAHRKKKEEAGQKGTDIHFEVEKLVKGSIGAWGGILDPNTKSEFPQVQHFINWALENNVKFLESEKHIYSKELFIGGIVDIVCEINGEVWITDIKTGSGIYPEAFAQMAGYELMLKEMGFDREVKGHIVLNLKKDGSFQEKRSISTEDAKNFFLACVQVYRLQEKFNNAII